MTDFKRTLNNIDQIINDSKKLKKELNKMAKSIEILQQRVADVLTNLEDVKTGVVAMGDQNITQQEVNDSFDQIDGKIEEIKQVINPGQ